MAQTFTKEQAAALLLLGFLRSQRIMDVYFAMGVKVNDDVALDNAHQEFQFMPPTSAFSLKTPVRAYVMQQWPKLGNWLLQNERDHKKVSSIIEQVARLRFNNERRPSFLSKDDKLEGAKTRREAAIVSASNNAARKQQLSTQRGAWNVCKR